MRDQASGYLPTDQEEPHEGNGRGQRDPKKALDKDTEKILTARWNVITDKELTDGARNLFTLLLDMSLDPDKHAGRRGQVVISNTKLRELLVRSARAIYGWTKDLVSQQHIWVSRKGRPNMEPMNVFHISALQKKRAAEIEVAGDGMWGNGYRRPTGLMPPGARGTPCKKRHYLVDARGNPLFVQHAQNQAPTRTEYTSHPQNLRVAPAQNDTSHPQNLRERGLDIAGATRTKGHLPPAKFAGETRTEGQSLIEILLKNL